MIKLGNEPVIFKKTGTDFFSIPSLTLSPSSASVQCAAVRTQDGWMRTPPHRNFPLLFCSITWNKKREVWHCMEHGWQNIVHILLCGCKIPRRIKHQSTSHSRKPKLHSGTKALWIRSLWNTFRKVLNILPEWRLASSKSAWDNAGHCKEALWYFKALKHRAQMRGLFLCPQHTRDSASSQAATLILWFKRASNVKENQAPITCIH